MDIRQNPLWLSFPLGRFLRTDVRISVWFPLLAIVLCFNLGPELGIWVTALLLFSILFHEFAHVVAARHTGGSGHEILLWPMGGLAFATPAPNFFSEFWTVAAGPLSNGVICLACLPAVIAAGQFAVCLDPIYLPDVNLRANLGQSLLLLLFSLNFKLLLLNLLPVYPLDGGQMALSVARRRWDRQTARIGTIWFGMIVCFLLVTAALMLKSTELMFVGFLLLSLGTFEHFNAQMSRQFDDSFMGYDFSQGYTSLEGGHERETHRQPGPFERWKQQRAEKKREREQQQKLETERRVDELLEKVHEQGIQSLTDSERRFLQRASNRYRSPGKE